MSASSVLLYESYGYWFSPSKLALLEDEELVYCLNVNNRLGEWLLHFHNRLCGRNSKEPPDMGVMPPGSAAAKQLDALGKVLDFIKSEAEAMGEVQLEKGLSTLYRTNVVLSNEAFLRNLSAESDRPSIDTTELLFRLFEGLNTDSVDQMLSEVDLQTAISMATLRLALPNALTQFDRNWDGKTSATEITNKLPGKPEITVAELRDCARELLVQKETQRRNESIRKIEGTVLAAAKEAGQDVSAPDNISQLVLKLVESLSVAADVQLSSSELDTQVNLTVLSKSLRECLESMGDDAVQFPVEAVDARLTADSDGNVTLLAVLQTIRTVLDDPYRFSQKPAGGGGGYRNLEPTS